MYFTNGGVFVKEEEEIVDEIFFEPKEAIVEQEIKRKLTRTAEEFATPEQKKSKALSRYYIRQALRDKLGRKRNGLYMCPGCLERKELRLYRVNKNGDNPGVADYALLCASCRSQRAEKKKEEKKASRKWRRRYVKGDGSSKISFYNSIRKSVFKRDKNKCVFCEALGKKKYEEGLGVTPGLGLAPLRAESRGGKRCFDNYVTCCAFHRGSKGDKLPLDYIWGEINFDYWFSEQAEDIDVVVKNPGATVRINMHLVAEMQQYFQRIAAGAEIDRSKAERLAIKLSQSDEDRKKEREQVPWE